LDCLPVDRPVRLRSPDSRESLRAPLELDRSLAGYDRNPGWALNLKQNPHVWVQIKERKLEVTAWVATGAERDHLWVHGNGVLPLWQVFQQWTAREFPIFVMTPKH